MSLEVVEKLAQETGNEELLKAVGDVKKSFSSNIERISFLEKDMQDAITKRDSVKSLIKGKLGLDDVSEDSLNKFLDSVKLSGNSEEFLAEKQKLEAMLNEAKTEKQGLSDKITNIQNSYRIEKELMSLGASTESASAKAYDLILAEASNGASFDENGNIVFKAKDGTTIRNKEGTPLTLSERYSQLRDSEEFGFLFKEKPKHSGSGYRETNSTQTSHKSSGRSSMSLSEKGAYIAKHGQEAFLRLPN